MSMRKSKQSVNLDAFVRAALYIRVSTEEQAQEGLSLDAQLKALQQYCRANRYELVETFVDAGESARTDKRPGFQQMIASAKQKPKPFDVVLVHKMDRFARNREDSAVYKALLRKELGIDVISMTERFDDTPTGKLTEGIMEVIAEFYSANLAHETLKGMREKASRGQALGLAPLGYQIGSKGRFEIVEAEAAVVRWIFEAYVVKRFGINRVARWLRDHGSAQFGPPGGKFRWSAQGIKVILTNRSYLGEFRWKPRNDAEPIVVSTAHAPIVNEETFVAAEQRLAANRRDRRTKWGDYLLRGFGRCALCGSGLAYYRDYNGWRKGRELSEPRTYKEVLACYQYYQYRCEPGYRNWVAMAAAEAAILTTIRQVMAGQVTLDPSQIVWAGRDDLTRQLNAGRRQLNQLQDRFNRQLVAYEEGVLDLEDLRAAKTRLTEEKAQLETTLREIQQRLANDQGPARDLHHALHDVMHQWRDDDSVEVRRALLGQVLDHFMYNRKTDEMRIVFRLPSSSNPTEDVHTLANREEHGTRPRGAD